MTRRRRQQLERRANPDPYLVAWWRTRSRALLVVAVVLCFVHLYAAIVVPLLMALPDLVRLARRELAIGALISAARRRSTRPPPPMIDLRDFHRRR